MLPKVLPLFFLAISLVLADSNCRNANCHFREITSGLGEFKKHLDDYFTSSHQKFNDVEQTIRQVIDVQQKLLNPAKGSPLYAPAEPFFWLRRTLEVDKIFDEAEQALAQLRYRARTYTQAVNRYLYSTYNLRADLANGCHDDNDFECTRSAIRDAGKALLRLQETYNMDAKTIRNWVNSPLNPNFTLPLSDTFNLGEVAYSEQDWGRCVEWMNLTADLIPKLPPQDFVELYEPYDYLSYCYWKLGYHKKSTEAINKAHKLNPTHDRIEKNVVYFESERLKNGDENLTEVKPEEDYMKAYKNLCTAFLDNPDDLDVVVVAEPNSTQLITSVPPSPLWKFIDPRKQQCVYISPNVSPWESYYVGVEAASILPPVIIFHNFLNDWECNQIKTSVREAQVLHRSTVHDPSTGKLITASYRSSQSAFLAENKFPIAKRVNSKAKQVTTLDIELADDLQIAHYGPGGHYEPHWDHSTMPSVIRKEHGNRIATMLIYLNDVSAGGATAFPQASPPFAVRPRRGSAVFWYNLAGPHPIKNVNHADEAEQGESRPYHTVIQDNVGRVNQSDWFARPDYYGDNGIAETRHAACPVQAGLKWVANKWFREFYLNSHHYNYAFV